MKCPLWCAAMIITGRTDQAGETDCLQEECAVFDQANDCCSELGLHQTMIAIGNVLGRIYDKMPHEGQFRK